MVEKKLKVMDITEKVDAFIDFIKDLHKKNILDGEILITKKNLPLLHLQSQDIFLSSISNNPQFMIGSVTKQFFAVALLKALYDLCLGNIEEVKHQLHLPVSTFLPRDSVVWSGYMPAWAETVTLHQLLSHTSGIFNYTKVAEFEYFDRKEAEKKFFEMPHSSAEIIHLIANKPLEFLSGRKFSYCNTGYVLIAEIIEAITSISSEEYIQKEICNSLGLTSTHVLSSGRWDELKNLPICSSLVSQWNYDPRKNQKKIYPFLRYEDLSVTKGGGSIISTATDLQKWNTSLHQDKSVLPAPLYDLFITQNLEEYGYGISIMNSEYGKIFVHNGTIGAYGTLLWYFQDYDISIIMLSHIGYNFHKLIEECKESLPTSDEQLALQSIIEKYPSKRGFRLLDKQLHNLFGSPGFLKVKKK